jgi:hypothetical protein
MSVRRVIFLAAVAALGIACVSADAFAARVAGRGGAVASRAGAIGARGGALAYRGGVGYRGGLYGRGYYRPGLGLAAGAVVGGAIAASQPWYGYGGYGYGYGYDGYSPGYATGSYPSGNGYGYADYGYNTGPGYYGDNLPSYAAANGPGYGFPPGYLPSCTYVGGPKTNDWACR